MPSVISFPDVAISSNYTIINPYPYNYRSKISNFSAKSGYHITPYALVDDRVGLQFHSFDRATAAWMDYPTQDPYILDVYIGYSRKSTIFVSDISGDKLPTILDNK